MIEDDGCLGVQLLDNPIGWNLSPDGNNVLLAIEIPVNVINRYEWWPERQHHWLIEFETREFVVPESVVNYYGPPVVEAVELLGGLLVDIDLWGI